MLPALTPVSLSLSRLHPLLLLLFPSQICHATTQRKRPAPTLSRDSRLGSVSIPELVFSLWSHSRFHRSSFVSMRTLVLVQLNHLTVVGLEKAVNKNNTETFTDYSLVFSTVASTSSSAGLLQGEEALCPRVSGSCPDHVSACDQNLVWIPLVLIRTFIHKFPVCCLHCHVFKLQLSVLMHLFYKNNCDD